MKLIALYALNSHAIIILCMQIGWIIRLESHIRCLTLRTNHTRSECLYYDYGYLQTYSNIIHLGFLAKRISVAIKQALITIRTEFYIVFTTFYFVCLPSGRQIFIDLIIPRSPSHNRSWEVEGYTVAAMRIWPPTVVW